ncbi:MULTISPECIES: tyrosine-protein kinase Wzc [unclassified Serratia (in: enterobacteria)]|uniref:tyrosine-protein kinase Wzc n=1 Tax=unclassified Serratia (in: enterobacteria) TaxID=2647522 RepID=UPI000506D391|nr:MULTISPECIES: tyrosine-protein kinase Wzc [unclassified Serratia (in: enterobacteria)]KFK97888.1 tyrosine protein kinase [Serratia sp. Ag2]KFL00279.1 tyrosine protein kinase [Serratia sp. Ag1]
MLEKNRINISRSEKNDEVDLKRLFGEVLDNRWLIIAVTSVFLTLGVLYSLLATPIYRADALVQVEQNSGNSLLKNINQMLPNGQPDSAPEIELLKSRMILSKTVEDLNLDTVIEQKYFPVFGKIFVRLTKEPAGKIAISRLVLPDEWGDDPTIEVIINDGKHFSVNRDEAIFAEGIIGTLLRKGDFSILISDVNAKAGTSFFVTKVPELKVINSILDVFNVQDKGKNTGVLGLSYTGSDPILNQKILNSITNNYLAQNVERKSEEDARSLEFLRGQLPKVRNSLDASENLLNKYRQQNDSVDLSLEAKSVLDSIVSVDAQLNELTFKEAEISKLYTVEHPSYRALLEKKKVLEDERDKLNKRVSSMPKTQQEILRLSRDVQSGQEIYMQLLAKEQELSISKASTVGNVRIIDQAVTQDIPVQPKKVIIISLSLILGVMLSIGYVLIRSFLYNGIESPEQLEELGINVYASVPLSEWQRKQDLTLANKRKTKKTTPNDTSLLLTYGNPADLAVEAIRSLRTSLHFAMMEAKNNILMISGASPGIGKTFISANLAAVIAQSGLKVLFMDCDMRKGYAHELLGGDSRYGLSDVLSGKLNAQSAIQKTKYDNFDFIARGQNPPNPSELLMHNRFTELLEYVGEEYDIVLVDTPPILAVTDAAIIGKLAGTALMVARFEINSPKEVDVSIKRFEQNGVDIKGVILNAVLRKSSNYFGYGYYHYEYKSGA